MYLYRDRRTRQEKTDEWMQYLYRTYLTGFLCPLGGHFRSFLCRLCQICKRRSPHDASLFNFLLFYSILFVGGTCRYTLNLLSFAESLYCIVLYCIVLCWIELAIRSSTVVSTKLPCRLGLCRFVASDYCGVLSKVKGSFSVVQIDIQRQNAGHSS